MNTFNRIAVIVVVLFLMIVIPLALILPEQAEATLRYGANLIEENLAWLYALSPTAQIGVRGALAAVGLIIFAIGVVLLALELLRVRRKTVQLKNGSGELVMNGVADHLSYHIDPIEGVLAVKPDVESRGDSVQARIHVETAPGVNLPAKSVEIQETARRVITEILGLELSGDVKVVIRPAAMPKGVSVPPRESTQPEVAQPKPVEPVLDETEPSSLEAEPAGWPPKESSVAPSASLQEMADTEEELEPLHESDFVVSPAALELPDTEGEQENVEPQGEESVPKDETA
jgi:hypothetical protein